MDQVCKMMEAIKLASTGHCLIMGDFNYSNIDWITGEANGDGLEFMNLINDSFLFQNVKNATRGNNILDLVLSSELDMVENLEVGCPIANSDHNTLRWTVRCESEGQAGKSRADEPHAHRFCFQFHHHFTPGLKPIASR